MKILDVKNASTPTQDKNETLNINDNSSTFAVKSKVAQVNSMSAADINQNFDIKIFADTYLQPAKNGTYVCPVCGSGTHGHHNTGLSIDTRRNKIHCFACGLDYSVMDLICVAEHLDTRGKDFVKAMGIAKNIIQSDSADIQRKINVTTKPPKERYSDAVKTRLKSNILFAQNHLSELPLADMRGLSEDTLKKFGVGYNPFTRRIIIPTSDWTHNTILINSARKDLEDNGVDFEKSLNYGYKEIFNAAAISADDPVIIVEGEIDAMSIWQAAGVNVVALGGTGYNNFLQYVNDKFSVEEKIACNFIVMLDNDDSGKKESAKFVTELKAQGYPATAKFFADSAEKVDANDILRRQGDEALKSRVKDIIHAAQIELNAAREEISKHKINASDDERQAELFADLQSVKKKIAEFDAESKAAIELLKNVETFTSDTVFLDKIVEAAAYAKLFDKQAYSDFARALKNYGDKHPAEKVTLNDWKATVKDKAASISALRADLAAQLTKIQAAIDTEKFFAENPDVKFSRPADFSITNDGVYKIDGEKSILACRRPVIISAKTKSVEDKTFKPILQYWKANGKRVTLPPMPASTIFNRASVVSLTDYGLPTSSHTASFLVDYLDAFNALNEDTIPLTCTVPRCGWYNFNDTDIFVDPRRLNTITDDGVTCPLVVDNSSQFANNLTQKGTLENWRKAYELAKSSPIARAIVAACVAAPLLKVLGERNFLLYIKAHTRAGKTTALTLGASCVGNEKIIRTFDATKNGLLGAAADVNDFSFLVDEKQVTDNRLAEQFQLIIYALANGIGRTKLNYDSTLKKTADWRTIAVLTGETNLLEDNATGGAYTRLLQLNAPKIILSADACKEIRRIVKDNYGLLMPRIIDKIFEYGFEILRGYYDQLQNRLAEKAADILPEYRRYIAVIALADFLLNISLGETHAKASTDAFSFACELFKFIPSEKEIDDTTREIDFVKGFIAQNQSRFIQSHMTDLDKIQQIYGKIEFDYIYITVAALKLACKEFGFNYSKVVEDLIAANFFIPSDKILKGCKTPSNTHQKKLGGVKANCFKLVNPDDSSDS